MGFVKNTFTLIDIEKLLHCSDSPGIHLLDAEFPFQELCLVLLLKFGLQAISNWKISWEHRYCMQKDTKNTITCTFNNTINTIIQIFPFQQLCIIIKNLDYKLEVRAHLHGP